VGKPDIGNVSLKVYAFVVKVLAFDIGRRRTGVAFYDDATGVPLPLDTIRHTSSKEVADRIVALAQERVTDQVVLGLPLLPDGTEGEQVRFVRGVGALLTDRGVSVQFVDERYTTSKTPSHALKRGEKAISHDKDSASACQILQTYLRI
jgi:putative transcription antitermination factor YqgF